MYSVYKVNRKKLKEDLPIVGSEVLLLGIVSKAEGWVYVRDLAGKTYAVNIEALSEVKPS